MGVESRISLCSIRATARWIDAVKSASADRIRDLWARLLAAEATGKDTNVSLQLLETLRLVDEPMANFFAEHAGTMYFARFGGILMEGEDRRPGKRLAVAGLTEELTGGVFNIFFQSSVVQVNVSSFRFELAYRLTPLGIELFEALHPDAFDVREVHRDMTRERFRLSSGKLSEKAETHLENIRRFVSDTQFTKLAEFLLDLIKNRQITGLNVYRLFPELVETEVNFVALLENEFTIDWEGMYHSVISINIEHRGVYAVMMKEYERFRLQASEFDQSLVENILSAAKLPRRH